jgi:hypothetical protein
VHIGRQRQAAAVLASSGWALPNTGKIADLLTLLPLTAHSRPHLRRGAARTQTLHISRHLAVRWQRQVSRAYTWASRLTATPSGLRAGWSIGDMSHVVTTSDSSTASCMRDVSVCLLYIVARQLLTDQFILPS